MADNVIEVMFEFLTILRNMGPVRVIPYVKGVISSDLDCHGLCVDLKFGAKVFLVFQNYLESLTSHILS